MMKEIVALFFVFRFISAQITVHDEEVLCFCDIDAEFPGGERNMKYWMEEHIHYPASSIKMGEEGKVYVSFVVEEDGEISSIHIDKGISWNLDSEVERVMKKMPIWTPAEYGCRNVKVRCRMVLVFDLI